MEVGFGLLYEALKNMLNIKLKLEPSLWLFWKTCTNMATVFKQYLPKMATYKLEKN